MITTQRTQLFVLAMSVAVLLPVSSTQAQFRGSFRGGLRGQSSFRSGSGLQNNPIANPSPSLTPHQLFHPRGSLSTDQVRNPSPSLSRPRSGVPVPSVGRTAPYLRGDAGDDRTGPAARQRSASPSSYDLRARQLAAGLRTPSTSVSPEQEQQQWNLASQLARLERELRTYPNGERWVRYFKIPVADDSQATPGGSEPAPREILARFDTVIASEDYSQVTSLPEFQSAHKALTTYIQAASAAGESKPVPAQPQKQSAK